MYNVEFVKTTFGGYRTEDVDSFVRDMQGRIATLERNERTLAAKVSQFEQEAAKLKQEKEAVESRLQNTNVGDEAEVQRLKDEIQTLTDLQKQNDEFRANLTVQLQQANETIKNLQDQISVLSERNAEPVKDAAFLNFLDKFSADFTDMFKKGQQMANEHQASVEAEINAIKTQTEADTKKLRDDAEVHAQALMRNAESEANTLLTNARDEDARLREQAESKLQAARQEADQILSKAKEEEARVAAISAKALSIAQSEALQIVNKSKAEGAEILDKALSDSKEMYAQMEVEKLSAKGQADRVIARAQASADEIIEEARAQAEETVKEAEYKLAQAKERGDKIIIKAEEKVSKQLEEAQQEYKELRNLIEKSLSRYRNLSTQFDEPSSDDDSITMTDTKYAHLQVVETK